MNRPWRRNSVSNDISRAIGLVEEAVVVEITRGLCRRPSPRPDERLAAVYLAEQLERFGFEVELQDVVDGRPNVIAILRGDPAFQSCMLNGHLDHPAPTGQWRHDPADPWIEEGVIYGAGVQDMKGGLAALC